jgi:hypothetical protein
MSSAVIVFAASWFGIIITAVISCCIYTEICKRKYGRPKIPCDIKELATEFNYANFIINTNDFKLSEKEHEWELYERTYDQDDGKWNLEIEFKNSKLVAFKATFTSRYSWFFKSYNK